ncbi:hypothetical protein DFH27DRAFT_486901 [Peziza echinospora]|nr:hypothetical protein DFH27DRAFT_486901 [Peziza echinospora]
MVRKPSSASVLTLTAERHAKGTGEGKNGGVVPGSTGVEKAKEEDRIIVGIDFGTTHSAVAWAQTSTPDEYEVITQWPGQVGKDWGKVPSDISYATSSGSTVADNATSPPTLPDSSGTTTTTTTIGYKWGFEVPPLSPNRLSWIKILLDPSQPRPKFVNPKRTVLPYGKKAVDIVTDYLTALRNYTMVTLERRLGREFLYGDGDGKVIKRRIDFVLTVPAVWSDKARQMTLEAAVRAGLGVDKGGGVDEEGAIGGGLLRLITEPEGAAEYALRTMQAGMMKVGECFVVCDAGGGTVDLISYKITSLNPLRLNECVVGSGGLCGAVYLDRRFEEFVVRRLGKETFDGMSHRARFQMNQYWETYIKREFNDGDGDEDGAEGAGGVSLVDDGDDEEGGGADFHVPVVGIADSAEKGVYAGFLHVTRDEVREIFEPIVTQVIELISKQVIDVLKSANGPISAILLVGGFGSSEYLYSRISKWSSGKIPILQPRNAWTAVVRGAIIRGLQGDGIAAVQTRLSRRYYGVVHDASFDPNKHRPEEKKWHELRCEWVVRNRMQWYIRRGDATTESRKMSFPFYRTISCDDVKGNTHQLRTELWVCDEQNAPDRRDHNVRKLAVMTSEPVNVEKFTKHLNEKGKPFWRVDYSLDMTVTSGLVIYEMRIEGQEGTVGRVQTKYE